MKDQESTGQKKYIAPETEALTAFATKGATEPAACVMLNLLKFKKLADYSPYPDLAPSGAAISGLAAYERYQAHALPYVQQYGGALLFWGCCGSFLIGPEAEQWDRALVVRYPSRQVFLNFIQDAGYVKGLGHRMAALEDSRLLPITAL